MCSTEQIHCGKKQDDLFMLAERNGPMVGRTHDRGARKMREAERDVETARLVTTSDHLRQQDRFRRRVIILAAASRRQTTRAKLLGRWVIILVTAGPGAGQLSATNHLGKADPDLPPMGFLCNSGNPFAGDSRRRQGRKNQEAMGHPPSQRAGGLRDQFRRSGELWETIEHGARWRRRGQTFVGQGKKKKLRGWAGGDLIGSAHD